ncbi:uncharacterized protein BXZ73DRAFT_102616 [Epithele typhae]|uniref:uncharacterized protein n=1 Tax=Epithele typhae TaxID=378194 RepID=UPI00200803CF|nr:uncharacterized protein BXZ73DRAFT_109633 [Epithele typhae]XP_047876654.1 uncharacterized protein BXZ73DRAFT_102616 [Epithele typhae]KAH9909446.1 hypothetical protein BXZ73DRAFT_109633 [Epithele typhae]KAH9927484.1 hypothetical protein BXZ73DRAFT_102616 [Epithele typhae]
MLAGPSSPSFPRAGQYPRGARARRRARGVLLYIWTAARLQADTRVYDWWDWAAGWASATQQGWAQELMNEAALRALPRPLEMLAGAMDSVELVVNKSMSDAISSVLVRPTTARFKFLGDNAPRLRLASPSRLDHEV